MYFFQMYWSAGLSLFTPLPFRPKLGGFGDNFRAHFFSNVGNIGSFNIGKKYYFEIISLV